MANVLTGTVSVYGQDGTLAFTALSALSTSDWLTSGADYGLDAEIKQDLRNPSTGEVIGKVFGGYKEQIAIDIMPVSKTTHSHANAQAAMILPAIGTVVTLASFKAAAINGTWIYEGGGKIVTSADGYVKMSIPLIRYPSISSTSLMTVAS